MADVGDIRPVTPIVPKRPADRVKPGQHRSNPDDRRRQQTPHKERRSGDDDSPHIDEYA